MADLDDNDTPFIVPLSLTPKELEDLAGFIATREELEKKVRALGPAARAALARDPLMAVGRKVLAACGQTAPQPPGSAEVACWACVDSKGKVGFSADYALALEELSPRDDEPVHYVRIKVRVPLPPPAPVVEGVVDGVEEVDRG